MAASTGIVNIRGKQYQTVMLRVNKFRDQHPGADGWSIQTTVIACDDKQAVVRAAIVDPQNRLIATGHAQEVWSNTGVNSTSALENAETSAIGRALAAFGFGGEEFASANEVERAIETQDAGGTNRPAAAEVAPIGVAACENAAALRAYFGGLIGTSPDYADDRAEQWGILCQSVAARYIELDDGTNNPDRAAVLDLLKKEDARLKVLKAPAVVDKPARKTRKKAADAAA